MKIFYIRVSTEEQNEQAQVKAAEELKVDKIYIDKASGKNADRPQLKEMLSFVREGDTVICRDISRIARNTKDLLNIVEELNKKKVIFVSLKESIDTSTPQGKFMLTVFGAIAERESIRDRQREGIAVAKERGAYKGRQSMKIDNARFERMVKEWRNGERTAVSIQRAFSISAQTFYRWIKEKGM